MKNIGYLASAFDSRFIYCFENHSSLKNISLDSKLDPCIQGGANYIVMANSKIPILETSQKKYMKMLN